MSLSGGPGKPVISQPSVIPYGEPCDAVWGIPSVTLYGTTTRTVWGDGSPSEKPGEGLFGEGRYPNAPGRKTGV